MASGVEAESAAELAAEAVEVYVAEAARCRLPDRRGAARVTLRCGVVLAGALEPDASPDACLSLVSDTGATVLVPVTAVLTVTGSRAALRDEGPTGHRSLTSCLREAWQSGTRVRVLVGSGTWIGGVIRLVGADHVEIDTDGADAAVVLPLAAVEAWVL